MSAHSSRVTRTNEAALDKMDRSQWGGGWGGGGRALIHFLSDMSLLLIFHTQVSDGGVRDLQKKLRNHRCTRPKKLHGRLETLFQFIHIAGLKGGWGGFTVINLRLF